MKVVAPQRVEQGGLPNGSIGVVGSPFAAGCAGIAIVESFVVYIAVALLDEAAIPEITWHVWTSLIACLLCHDRAGRRRRRHSHHDEKGQAADDRFHVFLPQ